MKLIVYTVPSYLYTRNIRLRGNRAFRLFIEGFDANLQRWDCSWLGDDAASTNQSILLESSVRKFNREQLVEVLCQNFHEQYDAVDCPVVLWLPSLSMTAVDSFSGSIAALLFSALQARGVEISIVYLDVAAGGKERLASFAKSDAAIKELDLWSSVSVHEVDAEDSIYGFLKSGYSTAVLSMIVDEHLEGVISSGHLKSSIMRKLGSVDIDMFASYEEIQSGFNRLIPVLAVV